MQPSHLPGRAFSSLLWKSNSRAEHFTARALIERSVLRGSSLSDLLDLTGMPDWEAMDITTPKAKALILLHAAAEVEHQFIVQYLYAKYCGGPASLVLIAQEEMGHLLTVQNLLAIVGEQPYLERLKDLPDDDEPSPFHLEPFQLAFVARFLIAESAPNVPPPADIDQVLANDQLTVQKIHRVGAIYAMLYWLFQGSDGQNGPWTIPLGTDVSALQSLGHLSEDDLAAPDVVVRQLSVATDWVQEVADGSESEPHILVLPASGFAPTKAAMRQAALQTIHSVAAQGEGATDQPGDSIEPSHVARLLAMYKDPATPPFPQLGFPTDPYLEDRPEAPPPQANRITAPDAIAKAQELDKQYEIILLLIALSVSPATKDRGTPAQLAVNAMRRLRGAARAIVVLPRQAGGDSQRMAAGPTFTFPANGIPAEPDAIKARLAALGVDVSQL